jgi:hypothetical protein
MKARHWRTSCSRRAGPARRAAVGEKIVYFVVQLLAQTDRTVVAAPLMVVLGHLN